MCRKEELVSGVYGYSSDGFNRPDSSHHQDHQQQQQHEHVAQQSLRDKLRVQDFDPAAAAWHGLLPLDGDEHGGPGSMSARWGSSCMSATARPASRACCATRAAPPAPAPCSRLLSSLPFLASLSLADNRFHSELPPGVPLPPNNAFSGAIPGSLFTAFSALQELYLSRNGFSGGVPPQLALLGVLTRLELQHSALTGPLLRLGAMRSLVHLDVSGNALSGSLLGAPGTLSRRATTPSQHEKPKNHLIYKALSAPLGSMPTIAFGNLGLVFSHKHQASYTPISLQVQALQVSTASWRTSHTHLLSQTIRSRYLIGSAYGWVVTADETSELHLVNPITRDQIALPSVTTIEQVSNGAIHMYKYSRYTGTHGELDPPSVLRLDKLRDYIFHKAFLSSDPSTGNYIVVLIHHPYWQISFARGGDEHWTWLPYHSCYTDCAFKDELLYALLVDGGIHAYNLYDPAVKPRAVMEGLKGCLPPKVYIAQAPCGDLLQIWKVSEYSDQEVEDVSEPDLDPPDDDEYFSVSEDESESEWKGNHVYFTDDDEYMSWI
ncbi:unnamed protein product [Miscanthus lutarioriparius]|uniref:KIB1-4 beta-propeller domain-containing protein n=1 Tax=Miscanthus lutarioriparius TaxID=422564 RepID=A0A811S3J2_9POAL|nr:unnamed protein product [Miscanthus lutarioriparius]